MNRATVDIQQDLGAVLFKFMDFRFHSYSLLPHVKSLPPKGKALLRCLFLANLVADRAGRLAQGESVRDNRLRVRTEHQTAAGVRPEDGQMPALWHGTCGAARGTDGGGHGPAGGNEQAHETGQVTGLSVD